MTLDRDRMREYQRVRRDGIRAASGLYPDYLGMIKVLEKRIEVLEDKTGIGSFPKASISTGFPVKLES